jgi:hypothetical protein
MLIEQIDRVDLEPFQRSVDTLSDVFRAAVQTHGMRIFFGVDLETEFGSDHHLVAHRGESFTHKLFIHERTVDFSGIEEVDAAFDGRSNEGNHLLPGPRHSSVARAQSHAAEPYGRDFKIALSQFAFLHCFTPIA